MADRLEELLRIVLTSSAQLGPDALIDAIRSLEEPTGKHANRAIWGATDTREADPFTPQHVPSHAPLQYSPNTILNMADWLPDGSNIRVFSDLRSVVTRLAGTPIKARCRRFSDCPDVYVKLLFKLDIDLNLLTQRLWEIHKNVDTHKAFKFLLANKYREAESELLKFFPAGGNEHQALLDYVILTSFPRLRRLASFCSAWDRTQQHYGPPPLPKLEDADQAQPIPPQAALPANAPDQPRNEGVPFADTPPPQLGSSLANAVDLLGNFATRSLLQARVDIAGERRPRELNGNPPRLAEIHAILNRIPSSIFTSQKLSNRQNRIWRSYFKNEQRRVKSLIDYISFIQILRKDAYRATWSSVGLNESGFDNAQLFRQWAAGQSMVSLQAAFLFELVLVANAIRRHLSAFQSRDSSEPLTANFFTNSTRRKLLPHLAPSPHTFGKAPVWCVKLAAEFLAEHQLIDAKIRKPSEHGKLTSYFLDSVYIKFNWTTIGHVAITDGAEYREWIWKNIYAAFGLFGPITRPSIPRTIVWNSVQRRRSKSSRTKRRKAKAK